MAIEVQTNPDAAPYRPALSADDALARIHRASGAPAGLRELRASLPIARALAAPTPAPPAPAKKGGKREVAAAAAAAAPVALSLADRELLVDQASLMLEEAYAHLGLKRALHAIDPLQRLRLLRLHHAALDERSFQSELIDIFVGLRDLHTNYVLPRAYWSMFAFLPFRVEEYYENGTRRYLVSWVSPLNTDPKLVAGATITHWNGSPIELAVARNAARQAGSNSEARRARGLEAFTLRWLGASLPPDEDWVTLTCELAGQTSETRVAWQMVRREDLPALLSADGENARALGIDVKTELLRRVRKALFDASALAAEEEAASGGAADRADVSTMPDVYPRFGHVDTGSGIFGYIRLTTFAPPDGNVDAAVAELQRILRLMPSQGLILDVRGNGGGYINFGERILQLMTPHAITPEPFQFATTALALRMAAAIPWLATWDVPLRTALATGAAYSQGFPLTDPAACNDTGQAYQGPVVLITDAFCYSTTDIFAAGFQDHGIGMVLGCHDATGAGGANVWNHGDLLELAKAPFAPLPLGAEMRVAVRRSTRVGARAGVPLEDFGVVPDERHYMTRDDLLAHNVDLLGHAGRILAAQPRQRLQLTVAVAGPGQIRSLKIVCDNLDRVDLEVAGRPLASLDIVAGQVMEYDLTNPASVGSVRAAGYRGGELVASARL